MNHIAVKVFLEESEYERLLKIEEKYKNLVKARNSDVQSGSGGQCNCIKTPKLSAIVAENAEQAQLEDPTVAILPSITNAEENASDSGETKEHEKVKYPTGEPKHWYSLPVPT
jgi:hypothetical protein